MATELPRYRRTGAQPVVSRGIDFAAATETQRLGQTISQQVEQMSKFVFEEQKQEAVQRGEQAVREQGAQPVLQQLGAAGGPKTIAERAAYKTANEVAKVEIETLGKTEINKILQQAEAQKLPLSDVQAQLQDVVDGLPASLSNLDPGLAGVVRANLAGSASLAGIRYAEFIGRVQMDAERGKFLQQIEVAGQEIRRIASTNLGPGSNALDMAEVQIRELERSMRERQFSEEAISRTLISIRQDAVKENIFARFDRLTTLKEQEAFIAEFEKNPNRVLGVVGSRTIRKQLETTVNQVKAELRRKQSEAKTLATAASSDLRTDIKFSVLDVVQNGGMVPKAKLAEMMQQARSLAPYDGGKALRAVYEANLVVESTRMHMDKSPMQLDAVITEMRTKGIPGAGEQGIDTGAEAAIIGTLTTLKSNAESGLRDDPMTYALRTNPNKVALNPINFLANPRDAEARNSLVAEGQQRIKTMRFVQGKYTLPDASPLTKNETRALKDVFKRSDIDGRLIVMQNIQTAFGSQIASRVFRDFAKEADGKTLGHIGGLMAMGRPNEAILAMRGFSLLESGVNPIGDNSIVAQENFQQYVGASLDNHGGSIASGFQTAQAIYAQISQGSEAFDEDNWRHALHIAYGGDASNANVGGVQTIRDQRTMLPPRVNADDVEDALEKITDDMVFKLTGLRAPEGIIKKVREENKYFLVAAGNDAGDTTLKYYIKIRDSSKFMLNTVADAKTGQNIKIDLQALIALTKGQTPPITQPGAAGP